MKTIRKITAKVYGYIIKPLLFTQKPDTVHHQLINLAASVGKVPGLKDLPRLWAYNHREYLEQTVAGLVFRNPVGLAAGFDKGIKTPAVMRAVGFGFMTGGSVTWGKYAGNKGDWFYRLPETKSLVVNAGLPSEGALTVADRLSNYSPSIFKGFPLVVSVAKTNSKKAASEEAALRDYATSLVLLDGEPNVGAMEINISCPNTFGGEPFTTPESLDLLLSVVDSLELIKPLFVKMPISVPFETFQTLIDIIARHDSIVGVTLGNLRKDRHNVEVKDDLPESVKGHLSGQPNRQISTQLIKDTYERYGDRLIIIGVGGIFSAEHAYEKIRAGATLVELITGLIYEGPQLVGDINEGLVKLLMRDGFSHVSEAIGVDSKRKKV